VEGRRLGNWVHEQRKKFKTGQLSDDRINLIYDPLFDFLLQENVVGAKLTVPVAISNILKYKKEHTHVLSQPTHTSLRRESNSIDITHQQGK
jgi:hypothetical protein